MSQVSTDEYTEYDALQDGSYIGKIMDEQNRQKKLLDEEIALVENLLQTAKKERKDYEDQNGKTEESRKFAKLERILRHEIEDVKKNDGWMTGGQADRMMELLQNTLSPDGKIGDVYIKIEQKALNLSSFPTWIYKIIAFFFGETFGNIQSKSECKIYKNCELQVIPIRCNKGADHGVCAIIDNVNKKIVLFDPNGTFRDSVSAVRDATSNDDIINGIFNKDDAEKLISQGFKTIDANAVDKNIINDMVDKKMIVLNNEIDVSRQNHADEVVEGEMLNVGTKRGACGFITAKFIEDFCEGWKNNYRKNGTGKMDDYGKFCHNTTFKQNNGWKSNYILRQKLRYAKEMLERCSLTKKLTNTSKQLESLSSMERTKNIVWK